MSADRLPALSLPTSSQPPMSYRAGYEDTPASKQSSAGTGSLSGSAPAYEPRSPPSANPSAGSQARVSLDSSSTQDYSFPPTPTTEGYYPGQNPMASMNQPSSYMDVPTHMSSAQPYASHAATTGPLTQYQYPPQPPVLPPTSTYGPASSYSHYPYPNGVASSQAASQPPSSMGTQMPAQILPLPGELTNKKDVLGVANFSDQPSCAWSSIW